MSVIQVEIPELVMSALDRDTASMPGELRMLAAVKLFELGRLSSGAAANLAGISRIEFLRRVGSYQVSAFPDDSGELERDFRNA